MDYKAQYQRWMESPALSQEEKAELTAIAGDEKEIESRFFSQLSFGTAGLRGTMGVGLYRMNVHVVRHATQAFAQVILEEGPEAVAKGVAVCYDCRNNSELFAREAACVMAANGIPVRLFDSLRPTPELSFAIREYGCIAGINITASHNPKEYNGYKVYWSDGAQLPPGPADKVAAKMQELDVFDCVKTMDYKKALDEGFITLMGRCGGHLQDGVHPLPRHRLQAHPRGAAPSGHEACDLRAPADDHRRRLPHRGLPQPREP